MIGVALAIAAVAALTTIAIIVLARALPAQVARTAEAVEREATATRTQLQQEQQLVEAQRQRDALADKVTVAQTAADKAIAQLAKTQLQLNAATAEIVAHRMRTAKDKTTAQILAEINAELAGPILGLPPLEVPE